MNQFSHDLSSASPTEAKSALRALFEAFPTSSREDGAAAAGTYLIAIDGYCLAAIQKAVTRFIRGEVEGHDGRFLPTPAQLSRDVKGRQELMTPPAPRKALPAPGDIEPTDESRARVKAMAASYPARAVPSPYDEYDNWVKAKATIPTAEAKDIAA